MGGTHFASREEMEHGVDLMLRTGCLLLENGADTSRVCRTMDRLASFFGIASGDLDIIVNCDSVVLCLRSGRETATRLRCCHGGGINMTVLRDVSNLSIEAAAGRISASRYEQRLGEISTARRHYTPAAVAVGAGFACGGFCIQFGCDWTAFLIASLSAMLGFYLKSFLGRRKVNACIGICVSAFVSTMLAWAMGCLSLKAAPGFLWASATPWHPLMACALFIVPGVPLINFVSDMLENHVRTGIARAAGTLLMVLAMSFGIALAIRMCGVDNFVRDLSMTPHHTYWEYAAAAAISATGFSMIFNLPPQLLPVVSLGAAMAVCTRNLMSLDDGGMGLGPVLGSFAGSALASLLCVFAVRAVRSPHHCISIPSVIPMVPGVLMYRALFALIDMHGVVGEVTVAVYDTMSASLIILALAFGVAIPNVFMRRMLRTPGAGTASGR